MTGKSILIFLVNPEICNGEHESVVAEPVVLATAPYFYGSILLRALKSKITVVLNYVYCGHLPTSLVGGQTSGCIPETLDSTCTVPVYKLICNCK
jgi:hypothetical protein